MKKMTPQMSGRLGGLRAGQNKELCSERGRKAAETLIERYGPEHFTRLALRKHGYRVELQATKQKAGAATPTNTNA